MKLLFVDPNKTFQQIVATQLARAEIEIGYATTQAEALQLASGNWQFVCLSLHLPDGDGLELCRQLRAMLAYRHTPIILFTSDTSVSLQQDAARAGATDVFLKKNVDELINFVGRYTARVRPLTGHVLYVEDSVSQAQVTRAILAAQGLTVDWCESAEAAWERFQQHEFDLVLTDLVLADAMTGSALISRIRSLPDARGDTPIVAVTAFDQLSRRIELFQLGINDYVAKPIVADELISRLRNLVERRNAERVIKQQEKRRFDQTLLALSRNLSTQGGDLAATLADICQQAAVTLSISRTGIWLFGADGTELKCHAYWQQGSDGKIPAEPLKHSDYPVYFDAVQAERSIVASDAVHHPATQEMVTGYLIPNRIGAMLDIPIGPAGHRLGVICHEQVGGPHHWTPEEQAFAISVGDLVALAIEAHERWLASQQLRLAGLVFEAASEAILITDHDNRIVTANDAFSRITGYALPEIIGQSPALFKSGRQNADFYATMWAQLNAQGKWQGEVWDRRKDGTDFPARLSITRALNPQGEVSHFIAVFTDVTQEKSDQARLQYLAYNDVLTDLPNRAFAETTLVETLKQANLRNAPAVVMCIDLDRFKKINSSFGHSQGDTLLREAGKRLQETLGRGARLARWSGAGFIATLETPADAELAVTTAQRCIDAFRTPFAIGQSELAITLSIGIGLYPQHGNTAGDLVKNTVAALTHAKDSGGNRYVFFNSDMERHTMERLMLESRLRRAIEQQHFVVHYQPKVDAHHLQVMGMEALVRWNDPLEGLIPPGRFIPLAEDTGQIYPINDWVMYEACRQNAQWHADGQLGGLALPVSVNLPAGSFAQCDVAQEVRKILADTGLSPALLELELTESAMMDDPQRAVDVFTELKQLGVQIAIDDFGTGYSSLAHLQRFPIDTLKIDRSFVANLNASDDEQVIVSSIIGLARSLKLKTVAEGIERDAQAVLLRELQCNAFQGYLYGRPVPANEFLRRITGNT